MPPFPARLAPLVLLIALPACALAATRPLAVPGVGVPVAADDAAEHADPALRYRVVFNAQKDAGHPWQVLPTLERAARFLNLLARDGVRVRPGDVVVVVSGPATPAVLRDAPYARRFDTVPEEVVAFGERLLHREAATDLRHNPNLPVIAALRRAGAVVSVCSQALHGAGIPPADVAPDVRRDLSGLTTLANLQLRGYALVPD